VANPTEIQSGNSKVNVARRISRVFLAEPRARPWPGVSLGVITHSFGRHECWGAVTVAATGGDRITQAA
jgi:hypothetical protein